MKIIRNIPNGAKLFRSVSIFNNYLGEIDELRQAGKNRVDVTVGSALDLFGGHMEFEKILEFCR